MHIGSNRLAGWLRWCSHFQIEKRRRGGHTTPHHSRRERTECVRTVCHSWTNYVLLFFIIFMHRHNWKLQSALYLHSINLYVMVQWCVPQSWFAWIEQWWMHIKCVSNRGIICRELMKYWCIREMGTSMAAAASCTYCVRTEILLIVRWWQMKIVNNKLSPGQTTLKCEGHRSQLKSREFRALLPAKRLKQLIHWLHMTSFPLPIFSALSQCRLERYASIVLVMCGVCQQFASFQLEQWINQGRDTLHVGTETMSNINSPV